MDSASACAPVPGASSPNSLPELRGCDRVIIHAHLCATAWCIANCAAFGTTGTAERMGNSPTADMAMQCNCDNTVTPARTRNERFRMFR